MLAKTEDKRRESQTLVPRPIAPAEHRRGAVRPHPESTPALRPHRSELGQIAARPRAARLHLFAYIIGNALFWTLWAAVSVTADHWYWWPIVPIVGWAIVLAAHLRHVYRPARPATVALRAER